MPHPPPEPPTRPPSATTIQAEAALHDLAAAPREQKKEFAVDHQLVISEVQLVLAEKRTSFALLRTGVTIAIVPLSLVSLLIATSALWNVWDVWWLFVPLMGVLSTLFLLGMYLVSEALRDLAHSDLVLMGLRASDTLIEDLLVRHGRADRVLKPWLWGAHEREARSPAHKSRIRDA